MHGQNHIKFRNQLRIIFIVCGSNFSNGLVVRRHPKDQSFPHHHFCIRTVRHLFTFIKTRSYYHHFIVKVCQSFACRIVMQLSQWKFTSTHTFLDACWWLWNHVRPDCSISATVFCYCTRDNNTCARSEIKNLVLPSFFLVFQLFFCFWVINKTCYHYLSYHPSELFCPSQFVFLSMFNNTDFSHLILNHFNVQFVCSTQN